jgi:hypothetical protein
MTVGHREEVRVLFASEMGHCNPHILIHLVRVAWRDTRLGGKCEFSHTIGVHLFWVALVERAYIGGLLLLLGRPLNILDLRLGARLRRWLVVHLLLNLGRLRGRHDAGWLLWLLIFVEKIILVCLRILGHKWWVCRRLTLASLMTRLLLLLLLDIDHVMIGLHGAIDSDDLALQANVH